MTAGSSPKLLRNSGDPEPDDAAKLARRCLAKASYGEVWPEAELFNPTAVMLVPRRCCEAVGVEATPEGGDVDTAVFEPPRELKSSTIEERRR
jgi:hypothetical protein